MKNEYDNDPTADTAVANLFEGKYRYGEIPLAIRASLGDGHLEIRNLNTGGPFQLPHPKIPGAKFAPDALWAERAISENRLIRIQSVDASLFVPEHDDDEAAAIDPFALAKWKLVREITARGIGASHPKLSATITEVWKELGLDAEHGERPTTKSVRAWLGKGDPETISVAELMSRSGQGNRASRLDPALVEPLEDAAEHYYTQRGLRLRDCTAHLKDAVKAINATRPLTDQLTAPSRETLRRRIGELLNEERYTKKHGKTAASKNFRGAGLGLQATRIGQLGAMDDTVLDGIACFDAERGLPAGRPNLCLIVDVASRCIVGYLLSFSPPTANTAIETIKAANAYNRVPKELLELYPVLERINCRFEEIVVDRGSNYTSMPFGQALLDVGTVLRFARVRRARDKAIVERIFHTLKTFLLDKLPGATYAPKLMREFGYDPEKEACLTISELRELIEYFIAVYHMTVHSGIGTQPAQFWTKSMAAHGRHLMTDAPRFGILLGETIYGVQLHRWGFVLNGIRYTHPTHVQIGLDALAGAQAVATTEDYTEAPSEEGRNSTGRRRKSRKAGLGDNGASANLKVKRNTANLGRVHAWVPGHGWLEYEAANIGYAEGLSLHQHEQIGKWAASRNMAFSTEEDQLAARASLNKRIQELAPDMSLRNRRSIARMLEDNAVVAGPATVVHDDAVIPVDPCDERSDPMAEPKPVTDVDANGRPVVQTEAEKAIRSKLKEVQDLDWEQVVPDEEMMEEHA